MSLYEAFSTILSCTVNIHDVLFSTVDAGSGGIPAESADGGSEGLSGPALAGITIVGLIGTFLAIVVMLLVVYVWYGQHGRPECENRSPPIAPKSVL